MLKSDPKGPSQHIPDRLSELDALRGLAALSVVCFHYSTWGPPLPVLFSMPWGLSGIHLFFIISGFVISMSLEKTKEPLDFVVSRFSKLYPCYWAGVILTYAVITIFPINAPGQEVSLKGAFVNLSMLQNWFNIKDVENVYWTLPVEISFYLVMFVVFMTKKLKYIESIGLVWIAFMLVYKSSFWGVHMTIPHFLEKFHLFGFGHLFFAGILFYNLRSKGSSWWRYLCLALCLMVQFIIGKDHQTNMAVTGYFLVFYLFVFGRLSWIAQKPLIFLGTISYGLYLIHNSIGFVIGRGLYFAGLNGWSCVILSMVSVLFIATVLTYGVEKPAMDHARRAYKDWKQKKKLNNGP